MVNSLRQAGFHVTLHVPTASGLEQLSECGYNFLNYIVVRIELQDATFAYFR